MRTLVGIVILVAAARALAAPDTRPAPKAEKDGLALTIAPAKAAFAPGEALSLAVTYLNTSKQAFRLPDQPLSYNYWRARLTRIDDGKTYVGKTTLPMGRRIAARPSEPIAPGKSLDRAVTLHRWGYAPATGGAVAPLPPGKYKLTIEVRFPERPVMDDGGVPLWTGDSIEGEAQIEIVTPP